MFKSKLLNTIVAEYEDYKICAYDLEHEKNKLSAKYVPEVVNQKIQEVKEENKKNKERYLRNIEKAYNQELKPLQEKYDLSLSGASITEDVKLLNTPGLSLTTDEVQYLADRYKKADNMLMLRAIGEYADNRQMKVDYHKTSNLGDRIKAVNEAYDYGKNYIDTDNFQMVLVQEKLFPSFDNRINGME